MATFSTSAECALFAGIKTLSATTSRPTTSMIDSFRGVAYSLIVPIIGTTTDDAYGTAKNAEMQLVKIMIDNVRYSQSVSVEITPSMYQMLHNAFQCWGIGLYEPNKDA